MTQEWAKLFVVFVVGVIIGQLGRKLTKGNKCRRVVSPHPHIIEKKGHNHVLYLPRTISPDESIRKSWKYYIQMNQRRSVRYFSDKPVPIQVIENVIRTAGTSPSGAHQQPWTYVVIQDRDLKHRIRLAAEEEEEKNYAGRMNDKWQRSLDKIGTDADKSYMDDVPYLIVAFKQTHSYDPETGEKQPHYYFERSIGISCGMLISAIHQAGLCTLTHTPTPMGFLTTILGRPEDEKPYLLLPVGYPADPCYVPDLQRKALQDIMI